jgi:hypothetical protein
MGDRIEDFDFTSATFLRHKQQAQIPFVEYFEAKSLEFAKTFCGRRKIYLDTKFWVKLCNAAYGPTADAIDAALLATLRKTVADGRAVYPFSGPLWCEVFHQSDRNTRVLTASLIDELSLRLTSFTDEDRLALEIGDIFDRFVLKLAPREPIENLVWSVPICGLGIPFVHSRNWPEPEATAMQKTLLDEIWPIGFAGVAGSGEDLSAKVKQPLTKIAEELNSFRSTHEPAAQFVEEHAREFVGALRARRATIAQAVELSLRRRFGSSAHHDPAFYEEAAKKVSEKILDAFLHERLGNALPTLVVPSALHAAYGRNRSRKYRGGDFHDFGHATIALPYCDCFATERSLGHLVNAELGFSQRYDTKVVTSSEELMAWIDSIPPRSID